MVTRSHDGGLSWEAPFPLGIETLSHGSPFGKIVSLRTNTAHGHLSQHGQPHCAIEQ